MKDGFVRVAAMTPDIKVADTQFNVANIKMLMKEAYEKDTKIAVFPEMCITGYTCNDLFLHELLIDSALDGLIELKEYSKELEGLITFVGLPFMYNGKLYNVAAAVNNGRILGLVPKKNIPNYGEFYERRQFTEGFDE